MMTSATLLAPSCALMASAHQICPYSNSTRGNMDVRLLLETTQCRCTRVIVDAMNNL